MKKGKENGVASKQNINILSGNESDKGIEGDTNIPSRVSWVFFKMTIFIIIPRWVFHHLR